MNAFFEMEFQVYSKDHLKSEHGSEGDGEGGVNVRSELPAFVCVAKKPSHDGKHHTCDLERDVPSRTDNLDERKLVSEVVVREECLDITSEHSLQEPCLWGI